MEKGVWMYLHLFLIIQIFNSNYILIYAISEPKFRPPRAAPGTPPDGGGIDITESLTQETINSNNMPLPVVPVLRPPPGWGAPAIPDPPGIQTPTDFASANSASPGSTIEETLSIAERGIVGPNLPKIPQITPPPPIIPPQENILESGLISSPMGL
uniref:Uncharacterized protein n=1 Tax=Meloidogyne hapla TaxID=6305 RepID=A0A1I8BZG5_MELHA